MMRTTAEIRQNLLENPRFSELDEIFEAKLLRLIRAIEADPNENVPQILTKPIQKKDLAQLIEIATPYVERITETPIEQQPRICIYHPLTITSATRSTYLRAGLAGLLAYSAVDAAVDANPLIASGYLLLSAITGSIAFEQVDSMRGGALFAIHKEIYLPREEGAEAVCTLAHELTHWLQFTYNDQPRLRMAHSEGHARGVQVRTAQLLAAEYQNRSFERTPIDQQLGDLARGYRWLCHEHGKKPLKYVDTYCELVGKKPIKSQSIYALGSLYFTLRERDVGQKAYTEPFEN